MRIITGRGMALTAGALGGILWTSITSAQITIPGWTLATGPMRVAVEEGVGNDKRTALCAYPAASRGLISQPNSSKLRDPNTFAGQDIRAERYRGKQVRISADVFADLLAGYALIGIRIYGPFGLKACWLHPIERTRDWEHEPWDPNSDWGGRCDVPTSAIGIQIYLDLNAAPRSDGRICVSKIDLAIIGPVESPDPSVGSAPATFSFFDTAPLEPKNTDFKAQ